MKKRQSQEAAERLAGKHVPKKQSPRMGTMQATEAVGEHQ